MGVILGTKAIHNAGKKSGKKSEKKNSEANIAKKQQQIDEITKQKEDLQSQLAMSRGSMFSDLGFENKKPNGTSGGMLPM